MDIARFLGTHIYTAIVLGSLVEGETAVVLAGFASHQGYAPWWAVTLLAATINFCWDQASYALGRLRGRWLLAHLPAVRRGVERILPLLERRRRWIIFGVRFMYGLRTAGPIALGLSRVSWREFVLFNALGALVWAMTFSGLGFFYGKVIAIFVGEVSRYEARAVMAIIVGGLVWYALYRWRFSR